MKGKGKKRLLGWLPGIRWIPHDIPSQEQHSLQQDQKPKSRNPFSSSSHKASADQPPDHGTLRPRKSTLSLTSEPDPILDARTRVQGQSMFFARLPLELRRMVYDYVMGEETVHLTLSPKKKYRHFICERPDGSGNDRECGCRVLVGGRHSGRLDRSCSQLLRVCRRMYSEAIPHLYRPHTFSLLHITHLLYLPSRLPQQRLDSIRVLRIRWAIRALPYLLRSNRVAYHEDTFNWERGWSIIASMRGLRDLYVVLVDPSSRNMWEEHWLEREGQLLEPVKNVTAPAWFKLMLPYSSCDTDWDMGSSSVRLRRPDEDDDIEN